MWPNLRYYPGILSRPLRKNKKNLGQDRSGLNLNQRPPACEAGVLTTRPRHSMVKTTR
jgi:hypothetical protein